MPGPASASFWRRSTTRNGCIPRSATVRPPSSNAYAAIRRTWRSGDRIDLTLPQSFRTESIDDLHPETVALMRGPVQYVALNPTPELSQQRLALPSSLKELAPQSFVEN